MHVHLGGPLSWYDPQKRSWLELPQPEPVRLLDLAARLGLPRAEISIATLNGRSVDLDTAVAIDEDRVEFFSPLGGG